MDTSDSKITPDAWDYLIHRFNRISHADPLAKIEYENLRNEVNRTTGLTDRQTDGLICRIDHQLDLLENPEQEDKSRIFGLEQMNKSRTKRK